MLSRVVRYSAIERSLVIARLRPIAALALLAFAPLAHAGAQIPDQDPVPGSSLDNAYAGIVATSQDLDVGYGLGFMAQRRGNFTWLGHSGGVPGYTATLYFDREYQLGVIGLRNVVGGKGKIGRLSVDVLKMLVVAKIDAAEKAKQSAGHAAKQ